MASGATGGDGRGCLAHAGQCRELDRHDPPPMVLLAWRPANISENQFSPAGKVVYGQAIMKSSLHQTARPQHGLAAGAAALLAGWGWRFLPVFAVFVTNVIVAIVAWYAVGALLR